MKKTNKILALVLALVTVFSLSATAFAATNNTVTVEIKLDGEVAKTETVNVTTADIARLCKGAEHLYDIPEDARSEALTEYTAADALIASYMLRSDLTTTTQIDPEVLAYHWDETKEPEELKGWGLYFQTYDGLSSDEGEYYYVGTGVNEDGETVYLYYWEGYTWNFYINGEDEPTEFTSASYAFDDLTSIQFDYAMTKTAVFEVNEYFPAEPAPAN